ncbi:MAG TPA: carboxylesterase/lipase family protein [Pseudomonadales bacterium]|nr:carboxylesterase/lipase family protein [Pseudomonadales bacterium]
MRVTVRITAIVVALSCATITVVGWAAPTVATRSGPVAGVIEDGVLAFKGIPYAAPPTGAMRWRPPQPVQSWKEPLDATRYGASCPQPPRRDRAGEAGTSDESCLFLNVWTKALDGRRPVMVWIHGGAFRLGSGAMPIYDGARFAQRGVVLVTLNYRLGRFGFFAHPALAAANPHDARGNYGLMDQAAALGWVKANVAAFGGDPDNVTVFGESAGGASVLHLVTSPKTEGLFQKAIVESGGGHQLDRRLDATRGTKQSLNDQGVAWAKSVGAADVTALRALTAQQVLGDGQLSEGLGGVGPVIDGAWVTDDPGVLLAKGEFRHVPLLIGTNSYEASVLEAFGTDASRLLATFGADSTALEKLYAGVSKDRTDLANQAFGDATFVSGARHVARSAAREAPVYLYHFDYVLERRRGNVPGAAHGAEIPYVFDAFGQLPKAVQLMTTQEDEAMAATMNAYWVNFASSGDPNGRGLPRWPRYSADADEWLLLRPKIEVIAKFRAPQLDFFQQRWEGVERQ